MIAGATYKFEVFGLRQGVLVMTDRQTDSVWTHLDGEATDGPLAGARMPFLPLVHTTWAEWQALHPETLVLSDDTAFRSRYRDVRLGVPNLRQTQEFLSGDDRLASEALVLGVLIGDAYVAYPLAALEEGNGVLADTVGGVDIVVFYDAEAESAIAFSSVVNGQAARFELIAGPGFRVRDDVANTVWDFTGRGVAGELQGQALEFVTSYLSEWYGWSAYHPATTVYGQ